MYEDARLGACARSARMREKGRLGARSVVGLSVVRSRRVRVLGNATCGRAVYNNTLASRVAPPPVLHEHSTFHTVSYIHKQLWPDIRTTHSHRTPYGGHIKNM